MCTVDALEKLFEAFDYLNDCYTGGIMMPYAAERYLQAKYPALTDEQAHEIATEWRNERFM